MPLLHRSPFVRQPPPAGLKLLDEIFHCKLTGEVFTDYEKFFERIILCNSLVWTCALSGRPNLTFQEALHSEKRAQEQLDSFPSSLQNPLIYLAHLTHRSRFIDVVDDIYLFSKDRYFIGESVSVENSDVSLLGKIIQVIPPCDDRTAKADCKAEDSDSDVICLDDDDDDDGDAVQPPAKKIKLSDSQEKKDDNDKLLMFGTDPHQYRYIVQDSRSNCITVDAKSVSRKKSILNREKCKLFLKQHCNVEEDGIWKVKAKYVAKFHLRTMAFSDFFAGPLPTFEISEAKKRRPSAKTSSDNEPQTKAGVIDLTEDDEVLRVDNKSQQKGRKSHERKPSTQEKKPSTQEKKPPAKPRNQIETKNKQKADLMNIDEEFRRMREEIAARAQKREQEKLDKQKAKELKKEEQKKQNDEKRQKRKEESELKKLERKQQDALLREFNKPREDLECEDSKILPVPTPVSCQIPSECFGDAVLVLEYLLCFQSVFEFSLPKNLTIDALAKALNDVDIEGLFADIVRELLMTIFRLQDEEDREEATDDKDMKGLLEGLEESEDKIASELIRSATLASQWPVMSYGTPLRKLQVDSFTLTEVVRLHLLSSGSLSSINAKYDYQQRGGYTSRDDPALVFCQQERTILKLLGGGNIFDLPCCDKLKIITVLIHQLLTFVLSRDVIDENCEKLKQIQRNLRQLQLAEQKREKDEAHYRWRKRMEECQQQDKGAEIQDDSAAAKIGIEENVKKPSGSRKKRTDLAQETDYDDLSTENIDWSLITPEERVRMKESYERKEKQLLDLAAELQHAHSITPLGRDRTFRRFWVFRSIPGLFVEDEEDNIPADFFESISEHLKRKIEVRDSADDVSESEKSDKENVPIVLSDRNNSLTESNGMNRVLISKDSSSILVAGSSGDASKKIRWAFYSSSDEIEHLLESLNPRGFRESVLRTALTEQKERLKEWLSKGNFHALQSADEDFDGKTLDKRAQLRNKHLPKYDSARQNLEKNLRDTLLDIEERVYVGSLGSLKVRDRLEWRIAIDGGRFDPQTEAIIVGGKTISCNGPSDNEQSDGQIGLNKSVTEKSSIVIRDLSKALLQIEQMLEPRYLEPPLGKEVAKKVKQKASKRDSSSVDSDEDDHPSALPTRKSVLERWEESLISSSSLAQIFLHLSVLESSITWSKSALHARCRICRRKGDGERMLLCDGCDRGHHMYCLKPPVKHVPEGDWFCPTCRPKDVLHTPRKKKKFFSEEEEESESNCSSDVDGKSESSDAESLDDEGETLGDNESVDDTIHTEEENCDDDDDGDDDDDDNDKDDSEEDSDSEIMNKPSAKIKFVTNVSCSGKRLPLQTTTSPVTQVKTRLRTVIGGTNASNVQSSNDKEDNLEPVNGRSKFNFYQSPESLISHGIKNPPKRSRLSLGTEALNSKAGNMTTSKRPRLSLDGEPSHTAVRSTRLRASKDTDAGKSTRSNASPSNGSRPSRRSGTALQNSLNDSNIDSSEEHSSITLKSRDKEQQSLMKTCEELLDELMQRDEAWPFLKPVTRREVPDYFDIIRKPMDFSSIRNKVKRIEYLQPHELLDDIRLIFSNCKEYNMPTAPEYVAGKKLESYFEKRCRELKLKSVSTIASNKSGSPGTRVSPKTLRKRTL